MSSPVYMLTVDPGDPFDAKATLYSDREEAMAGAVDAALAQLQRLHVRRSHKIVGDFLEAAAAERWKEAYELVSSVSMALAGMYRFPRIEVWRRHTIDKGETDRAALAKIARGLLLNFDEG